MKKDHGQSVGVAAFLYMELMKLVDSEAVSGVGFDLGI